MEVEQIEKVLKDTITHMMPDCVYSAENTLDIRAVPAYKSERDYVDGMIKHTMAKGLMGLIEDKLKMERREAIDGIHFKSRIIVMTPNEVRSFITIAANHIKAVEDGRER